MLHESLVGCSRRRTPFCSGLRFLRGFFSFGLLTFALMKAGGGVFCFSSSWMRAWATRNCSWVSCNCSRACFSCASKDAIRSSAVMAPVYQTRVFVNSIMQRIAYRSLRVEKGTQKQAEEFPCDEGIIPNTFITRSLQQYEYTVFPSKAKGRGASSDSPGHPNPDATGHHRRDDPSAEARFWSRKSRPSSDGQS